MDNKEVREFQIELLERGFSYSEFKRGDDYHIDIQNITGDSFCDIDSVTSSNKNDTWRVLQSADKRSKESITRGYVIIHNNSRASYHRTASPMTMQELHAFVEQKNEQNKDTNFKYYAIDKER